MISVRPSSLARSPRLVAALAVTALVALTAGEAGALDGTGELVPTGDGVVVAAASATTDYRPLTPARLADTRSGRTTVDGQARGGGLVTPAKPLVLTVGGRGGVPSSGVAAVALNVTATGPTGAGYLTAYPNGQPRPNASNVNFTAGQTLANSVVTKLGSNRVVIYSSVPTHVIVDVSGYFIAGGITAVNPARLADTRPGRSTVDGQFRGAGARTPSTPLNLKVTARGGVPANANAVALNVTVTDPTGEGYATVYPTGQARPGASNLNFRAGQTVANSVVAKVGSGGQVTVYSSVPRAHLIVDVSGYFTSASQYVSLNPARFADTRSNGATVGSASRAPGRNSARVGPIGTRVGGNGPQLDVLVSGRGSVPLTDTGAVVLNVTVTQPDANGYLTVFPLDSPRPTASSVNFTAGRSVPNLVIAKMGRGGGISIYSSVPSSHLIVDVLGYFPGVDTSNVAGVWASIGRDELGMPLSYDRCYSIPYAINPNGAQEQGWIDDIHTSIARLETATGIDFVDVGPTNQTPTTNPDLLDVLLIGFTDLQAGGFNQPPGVIGLGGSVYGRTGDVVRWLPTQFFTGFAYFDADTPMTPGFGVGSAFGQVALHELAHAVGLGHVSNANEIMNATTINRAGYFESGDLFGLSLLYKTQACPGSPATHGALRLSPGKHVPDGIDLKVVTSHDLDHDQDHG